MSVFIPCEDGIPLNSNFYSAWLGFKDMGFETVAYLSQDTLNGVKRTDIVVGGVGSCHFAMSRLGVEAPVINYPGSLQRYLGRGIWHSTINQIRNNESSWPVFVKSAADKRLTGKVIGETADLVGLVADEADIEVICSTPVRFCAEWRAFVRYGEILDVRPYRGNWRCCYDPKVIEGAVAVYEDAPAGYGIDFGLTEDGRTLLVEVNDGYALGSYGLQHNLYAQLLSARWAELMGVPDELAAIMH